MFRLQRFFSISSLVLIVLTAMVLGYFYRHLSLNLLLDDGENKNAAITRIVANALWDNIQPLVASTTPVLPDTASLTTLDQLTERLTRGTDVVKIKIYQLNGLTVYSTDPAQIGEDQSANTAIALARNGQVSNVFVARDHYNEFDQRYEKRDLMQTYVPLYSPDNSVQAVFEVYSDYTAVLRRLGNEQIVVIVGTTLILLLLYAGLLLVVRHANQVISRQERSLREMVGSLEARVAERTLTLQQSNVHLQEEIAQRQRVEDAIIERERRLQAIMDNLLSAVVVTDREGRISSCNAGAEKLFGYEQRAIIGQDLCTLFGDRTNDYLRHQPPSPILARLSCLIGKVHEGDAKRQDGQQLPVELAITLFENRGQRLLIASFTDISARYAAERQLEQSRQKFIHQEKMAAIGSLSAGIVHEIGNPIAAISGLIEGICNDDLGANQLPETVRHDLEMALEQIQRLVSINRDVAEFANPNEEAHQLVDFNNLVARICRLMRYDRRMQTIKLNLDLDLKLPALKVAHDQMIQVLMNLIANAADAILESEREDGEVTVSTRLHTPERHDHFCVELSIVDNGCGMNADTRQRATEAFFTTKAVGKGSGLGLSICHAIINSHRGELDIESEPGAGCRVNILLPSGAELNTEPHQAGKIVTPPS